ncbi:MAG TPA: putative glycolipid-binding domain-containing protein [Devosia sp.]|nr:putative glycolipid-binding domain-containing protein [Devosia sp.]
MVKPPISAFWRRLDGAGHDRAELVERGAGWRLAGHATYATDKGAPISVTYALDLAPDWRTEAATITGTHSGIPFRYDIVRRPGGWMLGGVANGLAEIGDLDLGFTPATNMPQIRRMNLAIGEAAEIHVAWFDLGAAALIALPQRYRRLDATRYAYESPQNGFSAILELAETGFVKLYPGLWELVDPGSAAS